MAELGVPRLVFDGGCPDPGRRELELPAKVPDAGDDFAWDLRDFDSFRAAMLEELAVRFSERRRWTPADLEVVLVEAFAAVLDQLSDMADRVAQEAYLETARLPESVYGWLHFIGLDLDRLYGSKAKLLARWRDKPHEMEAMRRSGPERIREQQRMTSLTDYAVRLEEHPLVERAQASRRWGGAWPRVVVTVSLVDDRRLNDPLTDAIPMLLQRDTETFHAERGLLAPAFGAGETFREVLEKYLERYRSIGQEVVLRDVQPVGIDLSFCLRLGQNYFQSEVLREARRVLGRGPDGFFEPGRLRFGEDLHKSDLFERLKSLDGVVNVELVTFKRVGSLHSNQAQQSSIALEPEEIAVCDNDSRRRERGLLRIELTGGRKG